MIKIAICDDDEVELHRLNVIVQQIIKLYSETEISIAVFHTANSLLNAIRYENFEIYLMDIIMPERNGIELGQLIRQRDEQAVIIYLSNSPDFAVQSYTVHAYYYLLKPVKYEELYLVLQKVLKRYERFNTSVYIKTSNGMVTVSKSSIIYIEYHYHYLSYYLENGEVIDSVIFRESFGQKMQDLLKDFRFTKVSSSVIVNMLFVNKISKKGFTLINKKELRITRTYQSARKSYMGFLFKEAQESDFYFNI